MKIIGIIAEYNPFHNGHIYHIQKIRELYDNCLIIAVVNSYFGMRGEVSILSKENKAKICLDNDIDIVVSLPFYYGSQSADHFAYGAIKILNEFNVDKIVFGSESNDISLLKKEAAKKHILIPNKSYAASTNSVNDPNDILGISYIKAINKINKNIEPVTIKRTNNYHDIISNNTIVSASNIRAKINSNENIDSFIPKNTSQYFNKIDNDLLYSFLKYKILTDNDLTKYLSVEDGLHYRLIKNINNCQNIDELIKTVKSKRYTYARINRMLNHILIGLLKEDNKPDELDYIQILGFDEIGRNYLKQIKINNNSNSIIQKYEYKVATIYQMITNENALNFEKRNKPIIKTK